MVMVVVVVVVVMVVVVVVVVVVVGLCVAGQMCWAINQCNSFAAGISSAFRLTVLQEGVNSMLSAPPPPTPNLPVSQRCAERCK